MSIIDRQPNPYIIGAITPDVLKKRVDDVKAAQIEELIKSGFFGNIDFMDDVVELGKTGSIFDLTSGDYDYDPDELL